MRREISPLDGRYADKLGDLAELFCEQALMRNRCFVELAYLEALADTGRFFAPDAAELAFLVEEDYHGLGIAGRVLRHLGRIAVERGLQRFEAEVLPYNSAMLKVFEASGWPMSRRSEDGAIHITLALGGAAAN